MKSTLDARFGTLAAFAILALAAGTFYVRSRPPKPASEAIIKELSADQCTLERTGAGGSAVWVLENRYVRAKIHGESGRILEIISKESGLNLIATDGEVRHRPMGFTDPEGAGKDAQTVFQAKAETGRDHAVLRCDAAKDGLRQEIRVGIRRGSPVVEISYACRNLSGQPMEGAFSFLLPGGLGPSRVDDCMVAPGRSGYRKLDAPQAFGYAPRALHPFRNWYALIDRKSREMLVFSLSPSDPAYPERIAAEFDPVRYDFGFTRDRLRLAPADSYTVGFSLAPIHHGILERVADQVWYHEVKNLYRNLDLFLDVPPGPQRIHVAPWGIATAELDPPVIKLPEGTRAKIHVRLNESTTSSPDLELALAVTEHDAGEPVHEARKSLRLGGLWHSRSKELLLPISPDLLHPGRYDVEWRIQAGERAFRDRLNLGVAADRVPLPAPGLETERPLERAIARRMSQRVFKDDALDPGQLSYILHHCSGLVVDGEGRYRDALIHADPTHPGRSEVLLLFTHEGALYRYDRLENCLVYLQPIQSLFYSELEEQDILANPRIRTVQAPVMLFLADGGGASPAFFQSVHLAASALDLGFCTFADEKHRRLDWPQGYREMYYGRLGIPFTPFLFEPAEEALGKENMPLVDLPWNPRGRDMARKDNVPREPEMMAVPSNLPPIRENDLRFEQAMEKVRQVRRFNQGSVLEVWQKAQLLWAAYGRSYLREIQEERDFFDHRRVMYVPGGAHRTVPSACGEYMIDLYMADETGVYRYFGKRHHLHRLLEGDWRAEILELTGARFEDAPVLFLFARRDLLKTLSEGDGFEEALFAAQNMALTGAAMGLSIGCEKVKIPEAGKRESQDRWRKFVQEPESAGTYPLVGGEGNRAPSPALPGIVVAAGHSNDPDVRWWRGEEDPVALAPPRRSVRRDLEREGVGLSPSILKEMFPEAGSFTPGNRQGSYLVASRRLSKEQGERTVEVVGFAAETYRIVPEVLGYHGPIELAIGLNPYGRLKEVRLLRHDETRDHMERILATGFIDAFEGTAAGDLPDVDMVTGATVTCTAILNAVRTAQDRLCGVVRSVEGTPRGKEYADLVRAAALAGLFAAAMCLLRARRGWRYLVMALSACLLGWIWNWSFTYTDLLDGGGFLGLLTAVFIALAVVSTLIKGRIYCGWLCPFGAVQELVSCAASPLRKKPASGLYAPFGRGIPRRLHAVKFAVLFVLFAAALLTGIKGFLNPEPFADFFGFEDASWRFWLGMAGVALSLAVARPFCRYLCPTGGFLACLHRLKGGLEKRPEFDQCRGCGRCVRACPTSSVVADEGSKKVLGRNRFECIGCEECVKATEQGACRGNP